MSFSLYEFIQNRSNIFNIYESTSGHQLYIKYDNASELTIECMEHNYRESYEINDILNIYTNIPEFCESKINHNAKAIFFCLQCKNYLCTECEVNHNNHFLCKIEPIIITNPFQTHIKGSNNPNKSEIIYDKQFTNFIKGYNQYIACCKSNYRELKNFKNSLIRKIQYYIEYIENTWIQNRFIR